MNKKKYVPIQDRACAYCGKPKRMIYKGEEHCSELCRKVLTGEITETEWKRALPVFPSAAPKQKVIIGGAVFDLEVIKAFIYSHRTDRGYKK